MSMGKKSKGELMIKDSIKDARDEDDGYDDGKARSLCSAPVGRRTTWGTLVPCHPSRHVLR